MSGQTFFKNIIYLEIMRIHKSLGLKRYHLFEENWNVWVKKMHHLEDESTGWKYVEFADCLVEHLKIASCFSDSQDLCQSFGWNVFEVCSKTEKQHFKGAESVGDETKGVDVQLRHSINAEKFEIDISKCLLK